MLILAVASAASHRMSALASGLSNFLGVSSLAMPGSPPPPYWRILPLPPQTLLRSLSRCWRGSTHCWGELDSLGEVLGAEGLSRGFIAPLDWDEELDSLLETLDSFREEPTLAEGS